MQQTDSNRSVENRKLEIRPTSFAEIKAQMYESIRNRHRLEDGYDEDYVDDDDADCYCE